MIYLKIVGVKLISKKQMHIFHSFAGTHNVLNVTVQLIYRCVHISFLYVILQCIYAKDLFFMLWRSHKEEEEELNCLEDGRSHFGATLHQQHIFSLLWKLYLVSVDKLKRDWTTSLRSSHSKTTLSN